MADKLFPSVYAISCDQPVLVKEAIERVIKGAGIDTNGFDHTELDGAETDAAYILHSVTTAPFLSQRRSAIIRRAERLKAADEERLAESLPSLPPSALLVLVFELADEENRGSALKSAAKRVGVLEEIKPPQRPAIASRLRARLKEEDFKIGSGAIQALMDLTGDDLTEATSELEKLICYCWDKKAVEVSDVRKVVLVSREYRVFALLDAICSGALGEALREVNFLLTAGGKVEAAAMRGLFPLLHRQLRLIWQARALKDAGLRLGEEAAERVQVSVHRWQYAAERSDFVRRKIEGFASRLTLDELSMLFRSLLEADMRLKGQMSAAHPAESVERMVAEMCEIVRSGSRDRIAVLR